MEAPALTNLSEILAALRTLDDEQLRAVVGRAQGLLLDRPNPLDAEVTLTVDVIARDESRLLAAFRTLAPITQRRVLSHVLHLARTPRRMGAHARMALTTPAGVAASLLASPGRALNQLSHLSPSTHRR